jgi:hypothetical protein
MRIPTILLLLCFCVLEGVQAQEVRARTKSGSFGIPEPKAILSARAEFIEPSGNKALDAGERAQLRVTIVNSGSVAARNVAVTLAMSPSTAGLRVPSSLNAGDIPPNASRAVSFEITAAENLTTQTVIFTAEVSDAAGTKVEPVSIAVATQERVLARDDVPPSIEILEPHNVSPRGMKLGDSAVIVTESSIKVRGIARDASGVAVVRINEREAALSPSASGVEFVGNPLLVLGENVVEVKAVDRYGNEGIVRFTVRRELPKVVEEKKIPTELFKGQRWAVIIGISNYRDTNIPPLRFADRDALEFYALLTKPLEEGGMGIPKSNVRLLVNQQATSTNIREAMNDFLKGAIQDDLVLVYFAGHGAPDPDRPRVLYLLAYDSELSRPGATAIKMQEVQDALRDYVVAKSVLVFADACHSRGVAGTTVAMRSLATTDLVNEYLAELARSRPSTLTFSASDINQLSQEDVRWGGGHGVFTHYLLEGLRGKANFDGDNLVRLGELIQYVTDNVRRETRAQQSPISSGSYDINLPMTIVVEKK